MPTATSAPTRSSRGRRRRFSITPGWRLVPASLLLFALGCGSEDLIPTPLPGQADVYWDLELSHHAVTLSTAAPYDTLQLSATPLNFRDEPLGGYPAATYQSTDADKVVVTSNGTLIAVSHTFQPVAVVATLAANNLRHADTVMVSVLDEPAPPTLASLSVHPIPPDSAKTTTNTGNLIQPWDTLHPRLVTQAGDTLPIYGVDGNGVVPVYFRSSDTTIGIIGRNFPEVQGLQPGSVTLYATATVFGVTKADTLSYRIGWPVFAAVNMKVPFHEFGQNINSFSIEEPETVIQVGGLVSWASQVWAFRAPDPADTIDITFADADLPNIQAPRPRYPFVYAFHPGMADFYFCHYDCDGTGNILLTGDTPIVARYFPVAGTYEYYSARKGLHGRVIVRGDD